MLSRSSTKPNSRHGTRRCRRNAALRWLEITSEAPGSTDQAGGRQPRTTSNCALAALHRDGRAGKGAMADRAPGPGSGERRAECHYHWLGGAGARHGNAPMTSMACIPRPCETVEGWLSLYGPEG